MLYLWRKSLVLAVWRGGGGARPGAGASQLRVWRGLPGLAMPLPPPRGTATSILPGPALCGRPVWPVWIPSWLTGPPAPSLAGVTPSAGPGQKGPSTRTASTSAPSRTLPCFRERPRIAACWSRQFSSSGWEGVRRPPRSADIFLPYSACIPLTSFLGRFPLPGGGFPRAAPAWRPNPAGPAPGSPSRPSWNLPAQRSAAGTSVVSQLFCLPSAVASDSRKLPPSPGPGWVADNSRPMWSFGPSSSGQGPPPPPPGRSPLSWPAGRVALHTRVGWTPRPPPLHRCHTAGRVRPPATRD
jgi:hypothetical protein